jgi:HD superfamily phosphohydrolase
MDLMIDSSSDAKPRRIRDPIHDLIEFGGDDFEQMAWSLLETEEFPRLRRIRQLGFSEFVFPGATHSRFAHSVGVFHTARQLANHIERKHRTKTEAEWLWLRHLCTTWVMVPSATRLRKIPPESKA